MAKSYNLAEVLEYCLVSPCVPSTTLEPANVVDALALIALGLNNVADAIRHYGQPPPPEPKEPKLHFRRINEFGEFEDD